MMTDRDIRARRRTILAACALVLVALAMLMPAPRAKVELTTARISVLLESGPVRFRTLVSDSAQAARPTGLTLSIGRLAG